MKNLPLTRKLAVLAFFLTLQTVLFAQNFSVTGTIEDDENHAKLDYASVVLLQASDSATIAFVFSDDDGAFSFKDLTPGSYIVQVFHTGFTLFSQDVSVVDKDISLPLISMMKSSETLSTAFIDARSIPVAVRGDTLVYNPNAFKTKNNATVEDLLKKLPGVQVTKDGKVIAQGEQVVKVLVNGKEFFGTDPTKATQNIDAESLEKVEILEKKSDDAEFSGADDGTREKVINLVLKKEATKGYFGKLEAGGGTEETYIAKATINYFKDENQITAIGNLNNLNQNGFDWREYYQMLNGNGGVSFGDRTYWYSQNEWLGQSNNGRQKNGVLGTNAHLKVNDKMSLDASYFLMDRSNFLTSNTISENYLPSSVIYGKSNYTSNSANGQHKGILKYTIKPDTLNWIEFGFEVDASKGSGDRTTFSENRTSFESDGFLNTSMSKTESSQNNFNGKGRVVWRRRFKDSKNFLNLQAGVETNTAGDSSQWVNKLLYNNVQLTDQVPYEFRDNTFGTGSILYGRASFTLPVDSFANLTFTGDNKMTVGTYEMRRIYLPSDSLFTSQSPDINTNYRVSKGTVNLSRNLRKKNGWYQSVGVGVISIAVDRELSIAGDGRFKNNYLMPSLSFYLSHYKQNKHRFGTWFGTSEQFPGTNQINPVPNVQNPIYITRGDLALDPYVNYNWGANFNKQNKPKNRYFHINYNSSYTPNKIISDQVRDSNNVTRVSYISAKSSLWNGLSGYYSFMIKKLNLEIGLSGNISNYRDFSRLNGVTYANDQTTFGCGMDFTFEFDALELWFSYDPEYRIQSAGFTQRNPRYWSHDFGVETVWSITEKLEFSTEFDLFYYDGQDVGQQQFVPLLNTEIQYTLDSNDRWTLGVIGYDVLKQNQNIDRNFFGSSYSETRQNSITQFFMFSVKYSIRKGKKKEERRHNWME